MEKIEDPSSFKDIYSQTNGHDYNHSNNGGDYHHHSSSKNINNNSKSTQNLSSPPPPQANILDNYEPMHSNYTRGIEITQSTFNGTHHFSIWEFSGYEPYRILYDQFIGNDASACIHLVAYNLTLTQHECFRECVMWLEYLRARMPVSLLVANRPLVTSATTTSDGNNNHTTEMRPTYRGVYMPNSIITIFMFFLGKVSKN